LQDHEAAAEIAEKSKLLQRETASAMTPEFPPTKQLFALLGFECGKFFT
jgi:hypothetical protein